MNMRSGLDSSVWNRQRNGTSIGEALGAVQGVMGIVGRVGEKKKEMKDLEENEYLNTVFGERLKGWDGKNQDDYLNRTGAALNDVLAADPKMYKKATAMLADAAERAYKAQDQELQIAGKKAANDAAIADLEAKTIANKVADMSFSTALNGNISYYLDMARRGEMPLNTAILNIQKNTNLKREQLRLPATEDEFKANPDQWVDPYLAEQKRLEKQLEEIKLKKEKSGLNEQLSKEKISKVGADYIEREKDLNLRKGEADLLKTVSDTNKKPKGVGKPLTDTGTLAFQQAAIAAQTAKKLKAKIDEISNLKKGPITGHILGKNPYDSDLQEVENYVNMLVPSLARGVFKEVGVLTDNDIDRYKKMVATARTDPTVAKGIMENLMRQIDDTFKIYKRSYKASGYNTEGYDQYESVFDLVGGVEATGSTTSGSGYVTPSVVEDAKKKYGLTY
jgi:hypothetical protein